MSGREPGEIDILALPTEPPPWSPRGRNALDEAIKAQVPSDAVAVFVRWWQLESWLRFLLYLELRAAYGSTWTELLPNRGLHFAERDVENSYMPSPDATNLLAYLDATELFELIRSVRGLVAYALPGEKRWEGLVDELHSIRNRVAHLRRPHPDDLRKLEQTLRDLEPGARQALEAFNQQFTLSDVQDPLHVAWVAGEHPDAERLIGHADRQYKTSFQLLESWRPLERVASRDRPVQHRRLIHASWYLRDGALLAPRQFWADRSLDEGGARDLIVLVSHLDEASISVTFSGADEPAAVADAIGTCFDLVLEHRNRRPTAAQRKRWHIDAQGLDWRVHVRTPLLMATYDQPFPIFRAEADTPGARGATD